MKHARADHWEGRPRHCDGGAVISAGFGRAHALECRGQLRESRRPGAEGAADDSWRAWPERHSGVCSCQLLCDCRAHVRKVPVQPVQPAGLMVCRAVRIWLGFAGGDEESSNIFPGGGPEMLVGGEKILTAGGVL